MPFLSSFKTKEYLLPHLTLKEGGWGFQISVATSVWMSPLTVLLTAYYVVIHKILTIIMHTFIARGIFETPQAQAEEEA